VVRWVPDRNRKIGTRHWRHIEREGQTCRSATGYDYVHGYGYQTDTHDVIVDRAGAVAWSIPRHASGTKPDTSLFLGPERKKWLTDQGGVQPTIQRLVDEAML